jgi:hypothetical protein
MGALSFLSQVDSLPGFGSCFGESSLPFLAQRTANRTRRSATQDHLRSNSFGDPQGQAAASFES